MPELLLEVGCEELPASSVRRAYSDLAASIRGSLEAAGVLGGDSEVVAMGTPRRLIVSVTGIAPRQQDQAKEQRGPGLKAAYDAEGKPTSALLGFCRSQGVEPSELRNDGQYVWVTKTIPGRDAIDLLAEMLPKAIRALSFDKTMRWGSGRMRWARPLRWLLAALDGQVIPFEIEGVASGLESRGHRFYAPEAFTATRLDALVSELRLRKVEPEPDRRRAVILDQAPIVAQGTPEMSEALIEENVFLTEWPTAISGEFRAEYMELPAPVLITAMAKHEKMFPVRSGGELTNRFVFIRNSGEDDTVRTGSQWVLNARFNDAKFFFDEDKKHSLDDFLEKTSGIVFQERLGSVRRRADRLASLARFLAEETGHGELVDLAGQAGLYAKADLSTGLVSELASLQGVIGGEYALRAGLPDDVCRAIATQYDAAKAQGPVGMCLIMADQLDKLVGYLGLGLAPSGSSDPFGLRRSATILIETAWRWPRPLPSYERFIDFALGQYGAQGIMLDRGALSSSLADLFSSRYESLLPEVRYDLLDAALLDRSLAAVASPRKVRLRLQALERLAGDVPFVQTATRPLNIVSSARKKEIAFQQGDLGKLNSADGDALAGAARSAGPILVGAYESENVEELVRGLLMLAEPINRFFESTMVMSEDEGERSARLGLLDAISDNLLIAGDWSKIVIDG